MEQNIIAVIWDFDKTLISEYMQTPIFEDYGIDPAEFWKENNSLKEYYRGQNIKINPDTIYLNHFITCTKQGIFKGLNNNKLHEYGKKLKYYAGIPQIFEAINNNIYTNSKFKTFNITVEHYIVSTGMAEIIRGSEISCYFKNIWGCEFIEDVKQSELSCPDQDAKPYELQKNNTNGIKDKEICQIAYTIDNTTKTRAIFEINKGANIKDLHIDVNARINEKYRRIPFENMIYIADGPSDIPAFSVIKQYGGKTFAIYPSNNKEHFKQVENLRNDGRIDMYAEADYSEGTTAYMWLLEQTEKIACNIYLKKMNEINKSTSSVPGHIV